MSATEAPSVRCSALDVRRMMPAPKIIEKRQRILPSANICSTIQTQRFAPVEPPEFVGSSYAEASPNPTMFINRIPSRAKPLTISRELIRSSARTGPGVDMDNESYQTPQRTAMNSGSYGLASSRAQRIPMVGWRWLGRTQLRKNTVVRAAGSLHAPPRITRYAPVSGPLGSTAGDLE